MSYKYLNKNVQIGDISIPLTKDMMLAGTHREGARKLNEWLNDIRFRNNRLVRNVSFDKNDKGKSHITKRFKDIIKP